MNIETIYEDEDMVVLNKPAGVLTLPDRFDETLPSLYRWLQQKYAEKIYIVHRLDRDTSGVICFAKNEDAHRSLSQQFEHHTARKYYAGIVNGRVTPPEGRIEKPIAESPSVKGKMAIAKVGKDSVTDYKVVEEWPLYSLMQFQIHTGRTHQIRVHMQSIGNPLVADELYGDGKPFFLSGIKRKYKLSDKEEEERPILGRLALHAYKLVVEGLDGKEVTAEAALPKDMAVAVKLLQRWA